MGQLGRRQLSTEGPNNRLKPPAWVTNIYGSRAFPRLDGNPLTDAGEAEACWTAGRTKWPACLKLLPSCADPSILGYLEMFGTVRSVKPSRARYLSFALDCV